MNRRTVFSRDLARRAPGKNAWRPRKTLQEDRGEREGEVATRATCKQSAPLLTRLREEERRGIKQKEGGKKLGNK